MQKSGTRVQIRHAPSGILLAEGARGWDMMPFEGNVFIRKRCIMTDAFRLNFSSGICPYKGLYFWMNLRLGGQVEEKSIAWFYWLPNPLFPFIWFTVARQGSTQILRSKSLRG